MKNSILLAFLLINYTLLFSQWTQVGGVIQNFSQNSDLVLIDDTPYMAYTDVSAGGKLFVESFNGTDWEVVGSEITTSQALEVSLEVDNSNTLHIAYINTLNQVNVKKYAGGTWNNVGGENFTDAFELDFTIAGDELYIAMSDGNNSGRLTVMKFSNGNWETVGNAGFSVFGIDHPSIKVNNGTPHVAFQDFNASSKTTVVKFSNGDWETVGSPGISMGAAQYNSLNFHNGEAFVAYKDNGNSGKASLMKFNPSTNNWEYVGSSGISDGLVEYTKLAFFNNTPIIAYNDDANSDLTTVKMYNGSDWVSVGSSFGNTQCYSHEFIISGTTAYCGFVDQIEVVLYSFDLGCVTIGLSISKTDADCNGSPTGTATASSSNASSPIIYNWSNGASGATVSNLSAGTYSVTLTDDNGCTSEGSITIEEPSAIEGTITDKGNVDCNNQGGGFATVEASGGTAGYTYQWSTGGIGMTETDLPIGTHTVTITDSKGCEETVSVTISGENDTTPPVVVVQDLTIALDANGIATVFPEMVDNGSSDDCEITGLSLDISNFDCSHLGNVNVTLTVTDAGGNTNSQTAVITVIDVIDPIVTCPADILSNFCDAPLDFPMPTTEDACGGVALTQVQGLPSGATFPIGTTAIAFTAIDLSGNQANCSFNITVQNDLVITTGATDALCFGESTGTATATISGGNMPYNYQWNDPNMQTTQTAENLSPGNYNVIITDDKGCIITGMAEINEPSQVQIAIDEVIDETGQNMDGAISITASGGTNAGYSFEWSLNGNSFDTLEDLTGLDDGEYCVTVTDSNGCTQTACEVVDFINNTSNTKLEKYISIFPNPTSDWLNVNLDLLNSSDVNIDFYDVLGRKILIGNETYPGETSLVLNLTELNGGIYFIKIEIGNEYLVERIIVE